MENNLNDLYKQLYKDKSVTNKHEFIKLVESSQQIINWDFSNDYDNYVKITSIIADYAIALSNSGYAKKSIPYFDKAINNIKNDSRLKEAELAKETLYEKLMFNRGLTNYNLKNYKDSKPDFKFLVDNFPENDKYKAWYNGVVRMMFKNYDNVFFVLIGLSILGYFQFDKEDGPIYNIIFFVLIISALSSIIIEIFKKRQLIK